MKITDEVKRGVLIIKIQGELDMHVTDSFREYIDNKLQENGIKYLLLNMQDVTFIDSSGLGVILGRYKKLHSAGGTMLISGAALQVEKVLSVSGLLTVIKLFKNETEALEYL